VAPIAQAGRSDQLPGGRLDGEPGHERGEVDHAAREVVDEHGDAVRQHHGGEEPGVEDVEQPAVAQAEPDLVGGRIVDQFDVAFGERGAARVVAEFVGHQPRVEVRVEAAYRADLHRPRGGSEAVVDLPGDVGRRRRAERGGNRLVNLPQPP
jgi:hypothetical protein